MAHDLEQLKQDHPDVAKLFADDWLQYRKSEILPELTREAQSTCDRINRIYFEDTAEAERLFRELVPEAGEGVDFRPPIRLDYGLGLKIGDRTFINMDLLIVGGGPISIGSDCLIGPRVSIYTPNHAIARKPRLEGWQHNADVTIGNNVWLGGNVVICPGVTIGDNSIIGSLDMTPSRASRRHHRRQLDYRCGRSRHPRHSRRFHRCGQSVPCDCRSPG